MLTGPATAVSICFVVTPKERFCGVQVMDRTGLVGIFNLLFYFVLCFPNVCI